MNNTTTKNIQEQDYIDATPEMLKIPNDKIKKPNMPISTAIHEAETLFATAQRMKIHLTNAGISIQQINDLKKRAGILRHAQSIWIINYRAKQENIELWNLKKTEGLKYQRFLRNSFNYAYADDKLLYGKVKAIKMANSPILMIQNLNDYCALGKEFPNHLTAINFDISKIDEIQTFATQLGDLYGKAVDQRKKQHELKAMRDRAFTLLYQSVIKIRNCGKFVFSDRPDISQLFASDHIRNKNNKIKETNNPDNPNEFNIDHPENNNTL
ncbi:MAG: hypothetical protein ACEPOV_07100 [Hyphomicrobiales bacterium]